METQIFEDIVHLLQGVDWLYNYPMTQVTFYAFEFLIDNQIRCVLLYLGGNHPVSSFINILYNITQVN